MQNVSTRTRARATIVGFVAMVGLVFAPSSALAANGDAVHTGVNDISGSPSGEGICLETTKFVYDSTDKTDFERNAEQQAPDEALLVQNGQVYQGPVTVTFELEGTFYQNPSGTFSDPTCTTPTDVPIKSWTISGDSDRLIFDGDDTVTCKWSKEGGTFQRAGYEIVAQIPPKAGGCDFGNGQKPTRLVDEGQATGCDDFPPNECYATHNTTVEDVH
jgi:hypothetical protein